MSRLRSVLLTAGAVLGSLGLLLGLLGFVAGVKPLVFRSGSMGPEIPTGALALSRSVEATDIEIGDVVSVVAAHGTRVTHRVVEVSGAPGPDRTLTLQGDANPVPDAETYQVNRVDRVIWSIPLLGYVIGFLSGGPGLVFLAGYLVTMLLLGFHSPVTRHRRGGHRKTVVLVVGPVIGAIAGTFAVAGTDIGTWASFTDSAAVNGDTVAALSLSSPAVAATPCTARNPLLGTHDVTIRWNGVSPGSGPGASQYEYVLSLYDRDTSPNVLLGTQVVSHGGAAGAQHSVTYTASLLGNLFSLSLIDTQHLRLDIQSRLVDSSWPGAAWRGQTTVSVPFTAATLLLTNFSCS